MESVRTDNVFQRLFIGSDAWRYRLVCYAFVFASACHLWLLDAWSVEWIVANTFYLGGMALLAFSGSPVGWLSCAVGALLPLLFARDQLTQSVLLLFFSLAGAGTMVWRAFRPELEERAVDTFLVICRAVTVVTYSLATLHKLNRDFLNPEYSCAVYGIDEVVTYWNLDPAWIPVGLETAAPWLVLAVEAAIPLAYALRRHRLAWLLTVVFHIPMTMTMAPAFVFVMAVGHAAFVTHEDWEALKRGTRRHWKWLVPLATLATAGSLWAHSDWPEWTMIPREWLLWAALFLLAATFPPGGGLLARSEKLFGDLPRGAKVAAVVAIATFVVNGLTPYLGVQYQHTAAMLSNLRIDRGCWNSIVFPESVRIAEDYVRIEEAYLHEPGFIPEYEDILTEQLWSPPQMLQMRRNWCGERTKPIYVKGTFRGREFVIEDICEDEPLPFPDDGIFGVEVFRDFLRYQKNLMRECPQECIH